ncbi:hypothetical protein [Archangium sp.]|jgi:hypothetical protein|uniref:hypothetical protein n=1 Tax=Archangium sp. TaxID=1872627 RepID=UPI002ED7CCDE
MFIDATALTKVSHQKSNGLQSIIEMSSSFQDFVGMNKTCKFLVNNTTNPASIYDPEKQDGHLFIEISEWFLKGYSVGYITGMLCHEVGAHYMADKGISARDSTRFGRRVIANVEKAWYGEKNVVAQKSKVRDSATNWWLVPAKAKQPDHIFASCYGFARYEFYRTLMIEFASIIAADLEQGPQYTVFTDEDLKDLVDCWLMDISSILATSDSRPWGVPYAKYVAEAYAKHLALLKQDAATLTGNATIQQTIAGMGDKTTVQVLGDYGSMSKKLFGY